MHLMVEVVEVVVRVACLTFMHCIAYVALQSHIALNIVIDGRW